MYVLHPKVSIQREGDAVTIRNPVSGSNLQGAPALIRILEYFKTATELKTVEEKEPGCGPLLRTYVQDLVLIRATDMDVLGHGFLRASQTPIGKPCTIVQLHEQTERGGFAVFGVAVDMVSGGEGGARHGPL